MEEETRTKRIVSDGARNRRTWRITLGYCVIVAALVTAVLGVVTGSQTQSGLTHRINVTGTFTICAGICRPSPISGELTFTSTAHPALETRIHVGGSGKFRLHLLAGGWVVVGRSPTFGDDLGRCSLLGRSPMVVPTVGTVSIEVQCTGK